MESVQLPLPEIDTRFLENRHGEASSTDLLPVETMRTNVSSFGAMAIGALACGALALGALAIGRFAVGFLAIGKARIRKLEIEELNVNRLRVKELEITSETVTASQHATRRSWTPTKSVGGNEAPCVAVGGAMNPQPLIAVHDVEDSSAWYQAVLGVQSGHGGGEYERLMSEGRIVMQLHHWDAHEHPHLGDAGKPHGNGVLLWFQTDDFDEALRRIESSRAVILEGPMVNRSANHREIWLRDPNGYKVVVAGRYGDVGGQRTNEAQPGAPGDAPQAARP